MSDQNLNSNYPDLAQQGGLLAAINTAFAGSHPLIEINGFGTGAAYAHLASGHRSAQVFIGSGYRLFSADFSESGTIQANAETGTFQELIDALSAWLLRGSSVTELVAQYSFCGRREAT